MKSSQCAASARLQYIWLIGREEERRQDSVSLLRWICSGVGSAALAVRAGERAVRPAARAPVRRSSIYAGHAVCQLSATGRRSSFNRRRVSSYRGLRVRLSFLSSDYLCNRGPLSQSGTESRSVNGRHTYVVSLWINDTSYTFDVYTHTHARPR